MLLDDATFVAVDTETTGLRSSRDRIIEVAAVKARKGKVVDRFVTLINPMEPIPTRITRITGINSHMVTHAPLACEVLPTFVEFLGDAVVVMHNVRFDLSFINAELKRAGLSPLANETVCTVRLARRLLRGLPSKSLASLKAYFGIEVDAAHRALPDAIASFEILLHLIARLKTERDLNTVGALIRFQRRTYRKTGGTPKNIQALRETVLHTVPHSPGVYFFRDKAGKLLYIGKAKDLARRVRSYFAGTEGKDQWTRQLVQAVHSATWTETKTELAAMLLELRLRKEHQPPFNRADKSTSNKRFSAPPFLRIGTCHTDRRITVVRHIRDDGAEYFGPFSSDKRADTIAKAFFAVYGERRRPTLEGQFASLRSAHLGGTLTAHGLAEARAFLRAPRAEVLLRLEKLMTEASHALDFERAAEYRNWLGVLMDLSRKRFVDGEPVHDRNAVIVVPHATATEVHFVRFGLPVDEMVVSNPIRPAEVAVVHVHVAKHFFGGTARPRRYTFQESDEIRLLSAWLHREQSTVTVIPWDRKTEPAAFAREITAAVERHEGVVAV